MPDKDNAQRPLRGRHRILEFVTLCAMGLAALAFTAGLYVQAELGAVSAAIAGVALFLVMAASQAALSRAHRFSEIVDRIDELQDSIQLFNDDVDRIDRFALKCKRFDRLLDRVEALDEVSEKAGQIDALAERVKALDRLAPLCDRIDLLASRVAALEPLAEQTREQADRFGPIGERLAAVEGALGPLRGFDADTAREKLAQVEQLAADIDQLDARLGSLNQFDARLEALKTQFQDEGKERQDKLTAELQMLETLLKQLAEQFATGVERPALGAPAAVVEEALSEQAAPPTPDVSADDHEVPGAALLGGNYLDELILEQIRQSIEKNKIDLYLQPIVGLPQRRPRYYEALTRLRNEAGDLILPKDYIRLAETAGIMPLVDNMMLFRSVQVLRRLSERSNARGLFCNISVHSLLDSEFFPEFTSFMEQNRSLADSLFFEFGQDMVESCGPLERESLGALASLGFRFSLDRVSSLNVDFRALHEMGFRFVKIDAAMFLEGMAEAGARIHQADMRDYLDRFGLEMIIEKIEDERTLANVLDNDVRLAQGYLFSEPRPVRPEVFESKGSAEAA